MARILTTVIEDSIHNGYRLTTLELEYPRYIHSEVMTHRVFSRNAQSSRAIPVNKLINRVEESKWYPIWVKNKSGMSADTLIDPEDIKDCEYAWDISKKYACNKARELADIGVHKQIVNRLIEPFSTIKVIVSATEWNNFFRLRIHPAAQQEIQELASLIRDCLINSTPKQLDIGEWHLPYLSEIEKDMPINLAVKLSTARCARVSYLNHDGERSHKKDFDLHDSLKIEKHMSPFEHVATPYPNNKAGNFREWMQYRYYVENEMEV